MNDKESTELESLKAEMADFKRDLAKAQGLPGTGQANWSKPRRPGTWKGPDGYELVAAVLEFQATHHCEDIAPAIKLLQARSKRFKAINQRTLERRFQEVRKLWEPWWKVSVSLQTRLKELSGISV
jgi:hypothetical protein